MIMDMDLDRHALQTGVIPLPFFRFIDIDAPIKIGAKETRLCRAWDKLCIT